METRATVDAPISPAHRNLILTSAAMTFALITMGGIVCVTGSARGCPDWPGCYGQVVPPLQSDAIIEYMHRFIAGFTGLAILATAIISWRNARPVHWVTRPVALALVFTVAVVIFGAFAIITGIPPLVAAIDLGSALMVLALLVVSSVAAFSPRPNITFSGPFAKLSAVTTGAAFLVLMSSVLVVDSGSVSRCLGWPIYSDPLPLGNWEASLALIRRVVALGTSMSVIALMVQAWRWQRVQRLIMRAITSVVFLFVVETVIGALIAAGGPSLLLRTIYVATTAAFWTSLVVLTVVAGLADAHPTREQMPAHLTTHA